MATVTDEVLKLHISKALDILGDVEWLFVVCFTNRDYSVDIIRRFIEKNLGLKKHSLENCTKRISSLLNVMT